MMEGGVAVPNMPPPGFLHMPRFQIPNFPRPRFNPPVQNMVQPGVSVPVPPTSAAAAPDSQAVTTSPSTSSAGPSTGNTIQMSGADLANIQFDGKRMRKAVIRKTVDYNTSVVKYLENRVWQRDHRDVRAVQPDSLYQLDMVPPSHYKQKPMNCLTTKFMRQSTNKFRCPIFCLAWTPEGRRLVTGASSGEFTLWNGLTFSFETILQAHETSVRAMVWSHNDQWMITADHAGFIKYWQSNMNNVKMYQGHKEAIRGISLCPTDSKFASCSDDGTVRVWDFMRCYEEKILRGHGADVKCVDWHPQKSLIASGSKDNQVPVKLWDPKSGQSLATLHAHKFTVMDISWNKNGNWLLTAARDNLIKLFDIRNLKEELQIFKGHKKEATAVAWHPINEQMFASGGSDGSIMFWNSGTDKELGAMEEAHDAIIWDLAWHPLGHVLVSGSNDHSTKFWTRNRPGDAMRDKYNLNIVITGPDGEALDIDHDMPLGEVKSLLPGMGLEHGLPPPEEEPVVKKKPETTEDELPSIPGLDWSSDAQYFKDQHRGEDRPRKKMPYSRPIPRSFEQAWISNQQPGTLVKDERDGHSKKGKIQSLLTLELPERPPPGLEYADTDYDEDSGTALREPGFNPRIFDNKRDMNTNPSIPGFPPNPFTEDTDHRPARDQDYRSDQDYRQDQDLRMDSDYRDRDSDFHRNMDRDRFDNYQNNAHNRLNSDFPFREDGPSPMRKGPSQDNDNGPGDFYDRDGRNRRDDSYNMEDSFNDSYEDYEKSDRFGQNRGRGRRNNQSWGQRDWDEEMDQEENMDHDQRQQGPNSGSGFNRGRGQNRNQSDRNRGGGGGGQNERGRGARGKGDRGFRGRGSGSGGGGGHDGDRWTNDSQDNDDQFETGDEDFRSGRRGGRGRGGNRGGNQRGGRGGNRGRGGDRGGKRGRGRGGRGGN